MSDYKQRMIREYQELRQRVHKLNEMLMRWQEGVRPESGATQRDTRNARPLAGTGNSTRGTTTRRWAMSDCYLCRKPLHGDSSSVDIKRWDPRRNVFFDETRRACAECVRRRNGYQSRRAKARRDAARVLLNKWLDKQMEVDDELA